MKWLPNLVGLPPLPPWVLLLPARPPQQPQQPRPRPQPSPPPPTPFQAWSLAHDAHSLSPSEMAGLGREPIPLFLPRPAPTSRSPASHPPTKLPGHMRNQPVLPTKVGPPAHSPPPGFTARRHYPVFTPSDLLPADGLFPLPIPLPILTARRRHRPPLSTAQPLPLPLPPASGRASGEQMRASESGAGVLVLTSLDEPFLYSPPTPPPPSQTPPSGPLDLSRLPVLRPRQLPKKAPSLASFSVA